MGTSPSIDTREENTMEKKKAIALILAAAGLQCLAGCEKNKSESTPSYAATPVQTVTEPPIGGADISGDNYNSEAYEKKINEHVQASSPNYNELVLGTVGKDVIVPEDGAEDVGLGSYRLSSSGIKLYYDETIFPDELVLTLEKYFTSFPPADYPTYIKCVFPSYITEMEKYLKENYQYDLKTSFSKRCASLAEQMSGDYRITRIKLEEAPVYDETKDNLETYFSGAGEIFGKDYYSQVKEESDDIIDACFFIMAEDSYGKEQLLVADYEIVFAVKDGKYYTFG